MGRILLDDGQVYGLEDRALAFEISAIEGAAAVWNELHDTPPERVLVAGPIDKTFLYRQILSGLLSPGQKSAFLELLVSGYKKNAGFIRSRAEARKRENSENVESASIELFQGFLEALDEVDPLPRAGISEDSPLRQELAQLRESIERQDSQLAELEKELEFAEDRASRAHQRLRELERTEKQLGKQLREARAENENVREERSRRIKLERTVTELKRDSERLREEYLKQEHRLHDLARRLAEAGERRSISVVDVSAMRDLDPVQILGPGPLGDPEVGQIRRQFAAAFHSDRVKQLPPWVAKLWDDLLSVVNEACDRVKG